MVVAETFDKVYAEISGTLLSLLNEVSKGLEEAYITLPAGAKTFAAGMATINEKLQLSNKRIAESTDHLKRVAQLTEDFEHSLADALTNAVKPSIESLERQVSDYVSEVRRAYRADVATPRKIAPPFQLLRDLFGFNRRDDT